MNKAPLDNYDIETLPPAMKVYLRNYGYNFNKKACEYAVSLMRKRNAANRIEKVSMADKEKTEALLKKYGITLEHNMGYNAVYVLNMGMADYYGSSISDEAHLIRYVKDVIDDIDANPENVFRKWLVSMDGDGEMIEWEDLV